jgi:N-acyl-phosphatidylethanolamine-hydrolysing phospholipase D
LQDTYLGSHSRFFMIMIFVFTLLLGCTSASSEFSEEKSLNDKPKHHTSRGFQNHPFVETAASKGILFYTRRVWDSLFVPDIPDGHILLEQEVTQLQNSIKNDRITWLGHASFLIKTSDVTILTDPFLSKFASPVSWAGPRRYVGVPIPIHKLPPIDVVIVSHNHYDHLDDKTVGSLKNKDKIHVVVPLGLKSFFTERGYTKVTELDWEQSASIKGVKLTAEPSVHDSARSISDHNKTLWASWIIESDHKRIIFIGDTAYSDTIFDDIGHKYGSFDYAVLPIGAYEPRELLWMSHTTPEEAVSIGVDVGAKTLIASHWGTISSLSDEPAFEPPVRFKKSGIDNGFSDTNLWVLKVGETRSISVTKSQSVEADRQQFKILN